jgi:hypothetical protein
VTVPAATRGGAGARRAVTVVGGLVAGALLAGSGLLGAAASVGGDGADRLALGAYCRHRYGDDAAPYQPRELDRWGCSAWTNGVWRLEPVDLVAACRWQRGPSARLGVVDTSERELACTE